MTPTTQPLFNMTDVISLIREIGVILGVILSIIVALKASTKASNAENKADTSTGRIDDVVKTQQTQSTQIVDLAQKMPPIVPTRFDDFNKGS